MFVDDATFFGSETNHEGLCNYMNDIVLSQAVELYAANMFLLNVAKNQNMSFSSDFIALEEAENESFVKLLGIQFDPKLTWHVHIS